MNGVRRLPNSNSEKRQELKHQPSWMVASHCWRRFHRGVGRAAVVGRTTSPIVPRVGGCRGWPGLAGVATASRVLLTTVVLIGYSSLKQDDVMYSYLSPEYIVNI